LVTTGLSASKKILITGAEGFLGSYLTYYLLKKGYKLVITVKDSVWRPLLKEAIKKNDIEIFYGSVLTREGRRDIIPYLKNVGTVIHLERDWGGEDIQKGLYKEINNNLLGTIEFVKLVYQFADKVIFTSSADVYGEVKRYPVQEEMISNPSSFYAITKLTIENYLRKIAEQLSKKLIILRISSIYGPYEISNKAVPNFIKAILKNEQPEIRSNKAIYRDFIFIEDVCSAINLSVKCNLKNFVILNIASSKAISLERLINNIYKITGKKKNITKSKTMKNKDEKYLINIDKAERLIGFYPKFNLNRGLKIEIDWLKKYLKNNGEL
jgi:UDP-glucose 4-epimerase